MFRRFVTLAALALVQSAATADAEAQAFLRAPQPQFGGRLMLDGYLSQYDLALPDARAQLEGVGARVMVALAPMRAPRRERLAEHFAIGGFVGSTSEEGLGESSALRASLYGVQLDVRPLRTPIGGIVEPVISLGAGGMRVEETDFESLPLVPHDLPRVERPSHVIERETHGILAPAVGVVFSPTPDFAVRMDLRRLVSNENRIGRSSELAAGVSIRL